MKKLLIICLLFSLYSCDILKESQKTKKDIQAISTEKTTIKNTGGTISSEILKEKDRPKDDNGALKDTIVVIKKDEITKTIYYKPDGSVRTTVECPETYITQEKALELIDNSKEKESNKEESFNSEIIIYFMIGLAVIVCGAIFIFMWQMKGQSKALFSVLDKIS